MTRARAARRLAAAAIVGGGGVGVLGGSAVGLLKMQAGLARRAIGVSDERPPSPDGVYGADLPGDPLRFVMLGDSTGVGYGMTRAEDTPPSLIGAGLSQIAGRPVEVTSQAVVGAVSADLAEQVELALPTRPHVAAIVIGANDVTHVSNVNAISGAVAALGEAVRALRQHGCEVVVGTCPDLGSVRPLPQPLRLIARQFSRRLAAAQVITVVEAGGRAVSLSDLLQRDFWSAPTEMFGDDRFHPSATGYASMVAAMLPSVAVAAGVWDEDEESAAFPEGVVLPISFAAAEAADTAGTEVSRTQVGGAERGPRGRWAALRVVRRSP
ncbi:SGNH/GDSL hydrolase family protein [Mumia sp. zg.B17]|uniref:SGNH/GDSL hydrolase family protein n=1 Tax=unclassified Mumia TaxID=2621872 RepID=UPI001C6F1AB9|nr:MULTISPECIES: SGNH/GDSL hydrolase family protein [unclassified Mumia]MBW9207923.1 SGNH/GDSL hydrolase family protein [Mumia sp. zg.B17]MBW9210811.1 SGNH/GDSL hydrolase family protein [Mumia sp. zg.B21]